MWLDGLGHFADEPARALRDLHEVDAGLRQFLGEGAREHRIRIVVIVRQAIERGLPRAGREHREHAFRQLRHRREPAAAGDRAGAGALERIVAAGVEHQDRGARLLFCSRSMMRSARMEASRTSSSWPSVAAGTSVGSRKFWPAISKPWPA